MRETHPKLLLLGWVLLAFASFFLFGPGFLHPQTESPALEPGVPQVNSSGVSMRWLVGHSEWGDHYRVELCYSLPDQRDWLLSNPLSRTSPLLRMGGEEVLPIEEGTMYWHIDADGQITERCSYLLFYGQPFLNEKTLTLHIRSIEAPKAGQPDICQEVRDTQGQRGQELTISCIERVGFTTKLIERLPLFDLHNDATLRRPIDLLERDVVNGEWTFTFPINPPFLIR